MPQKNSRYDKTTGFVFDRNEPAPFKGFRPRRIGPAQGVLEHTLRAWERLDQLALNYYNEDRLWWRILDANLDILYGGSHTGDENAGKILLVPRSQEPGGTR